MEIRNQVSGLFINMKDRYNEYRSKHLRISAALSVGRKK